jgi:hypothetical protein
MKKGLLLSLVFLSLFLLACGTPEPQSLDDYYSAVDQSCTVDEDCVVKDVGNCCGYGPRCVASSYSPNTDLVTRLCEKEGVFSTCGIVELDGCSCVESRCAPKN